MTDAAGAAAPSSPRSSFVTVLAWLGIIFFGLSSVVGLFQAFMFRTMFQPGGPFDAMRSDSFPGPPMPHEMQYVLDHVEAFFLIYAACVALGLVASIGLLHRRNWARVIYIALLGANIVWSVVALLAGRHLMAAMPFPPADTLPNAPDVAGMMRMMSIFMTALTVVTSAVCAWLIVRLVSRPIRAEFVGEES